VPRPNVRHWWVLHNGRGGFGLFLGSRGGWPAQDMGGLHCSEQEETRRDAYDVPAQAPVRGTLYPSYRGTYNRGNTWHGWKSHGWRIELNRTYNPQGRPATKPAMLITRPLMLYTENHGSRICTTG
jgi:hypothetical protein